MRTDLITLRQMRAVAAVADVGSLTAAAALLRLTPPAIHSQIKSLERALGTALVQRASDNSGSALTPAGCEVVEAFHRIEGLLAQCAANVTAISRGLAGRVVIGVVSTGKYFAPWLIKSLRRVCPGVDITLRVGNREAMIGELERRGVDLLIMGRPPRHPPMDADILGRHPHGLLASPDHELAGLPEVGAEQLLRETILSREEGSGTRIVMVRYLDQIGSGRPFEILVMPSNETIKQAVMAGLGIGFLSLHTVIDELASGRLVQLRAEGLPIERQWFVVSLADPAPRAVVARVRATITELRGSYLPAVL